MAWFACAALTLALTLAACAPQEVGERVGTSLNRASVTTGRALAKVGDRTGEVLQNAGSNLRDTINPPPRYPQDVDPNDAPGDAPITRFDRSMAY